MLSASQRAAARHNLETRMTETVRAGVFTDTTNATTGDAERSITITRYVGKARVKYAATAVQDQSVASQLVSAQAVIVSLPTGSPVLFESDEIEVLASAADDALVGRRFKVGGSAAFGQTSAHRYPVEELS